MLGSSRGAVWGLVLLVLGWSVRCGAQVVAVPRAEQALLEMANRDRAAHGLPALGWDGALARAARAHAVRVAVEPGELEHAYTGEPELVERASRAGARFTVVSENLARGARVPGELEAIWMRTPVHRANLLSRELTVVGIGVIERGGLLYAVEDFARVAPAIGVGGVEVEVVSAVRRAGVAAVTASEAARRSCAGEGAAEAGARLVVQWDGPTPGELPPTLVEALGRGYRRVEVGACASREGKAGFATMRVAALLF